MKKAWIVAALLLSLVSAATAQEKGAAASRVLETKVHKLWEAFKNKDKATLSALLDGDFRQFEEGLSAFGDKKAEVNSVDEFATPELHAQRFHRKINWTQCCAGYLHCAIRGQIGRRNLKGTQRLR